MQAFGIRDTTIRSQGKSTMTEQTWLTSSEANIFYTPSTPTRLDAVLNPSADSRRTSSPYELQSREVVSPRPSSCLTLDALDFDVVKLRSRENRRQHFSSRIGSPISTPCAV